MAMTIRDIAREAGVSTATVSRALRGLPNVDPTTRHHVMSVAERMDYVISPTASRLATGRTRAIAVITPFVARWYFATVLMGAERVFHEADFDLLLFGTGEPSEPHRVPSHRRLRHKADGFLVLSLDPESEDVRGLFDLDLPVVLVGTTSPKAVATTGRRRQGRLPGHPAPDRPRAPRHRDHLGPRAAQPVHSRCGPVHGFPAHDARGRPDAGPGLHDVRLVHDRRR